MSWSAAQYLKFEDQRTRPIRDLLAAVPTTELRRAVDLGCGPGNSTEEILRRWPRAEVVGVDSSPDMIAAARRRLPQLRFEQTQLQDWSDPAPWDLMLANAVLQWAPDHAHLFPSLVARLAPGGSLAIQMPDNLDEPSHCIMREVAAAGPWAAKLAGALESRAEILGAAGYWRLLSPLCPRVDVWRTTYHHPLPGGVDAIVEWFRGSTLRPYLDRLEPGEQAAFLAAYGDGLRDAYPADANGVVLLAFPRLFLVATR